MSFYSTSVFAQGGIRVSGTVIDSSGEPLPGVNVVIKGTTTGNVTSIDGEYNITVPTIGSVLQFSFVGYISQELTVGTRTTINVTLAEDSELIDEVIVVGYGTQQKATLTGAISTVGSEAFDSKGVIANPIQALQGQVPGLVITRGSSAPGREGWTYNIRGQASVNDPGTLVLVDGIPGAIDDINPDDIDNISFLKDAAAAVYGSRAAGGVVLITTKRGKSQSAKVSYKGNVALKIPSMQQKFMNMQQWAYSIEEATLSTPTANAYPIPGAAIGAMPYWAIQAMKSYDPRYYETVQDYKIGPNSGGIHDIGFLDYDMNDITWNNAVSQSHSLSLQGGNDRDKYNISLAYMRDDSPLRSEWGDDNTNRYNIRVNNDIKVAKWLDIATDLAFDRRELTFPTQRPNAISGNPPGSPLLTPAGNPFGWASNMTPVVMAKFGGTTSRATNSFKVNISPKFHLMEGLNLIGNIYYNPSDRNNMAYQNMVTWYDYHDVPYNFVSPNNSYVNRLARTTMNQQFQGYLNYKKKINTSHSLDIMAGASYEKEKATEFIVEKGALDVQDLHSLNTGTIYNKGSDEINAWAMASYFGRINYDYQGKYIAEVLGRYDGTSKFITGKKWAPFYGVSIGWRLSEESFLKSLDIFDNLKIRASYGEIGNQVGINNYDYIALLNMNTASGNSANFPLFGSDGSPVYGQTITQDNVVSIDRTWEVIKTTNIGLDFTVLNNRLSGSVDYFEKKNNNMLSSITYPQIFGATAPKTNSGKMEVKGWEVSLSWRDKIGDLHYNITTNISDNNNKLIDMENASTKTWNSRTSYLIDYPINTYWGMEFVKLIENEAELQSYGKTVNNNLISSSLLRVGDPIYADLDGDGIISREDVKLLGDNTPHYSYAVSLGADYKGFDLSLVVQGVGKQTILRNTSAATMLVANTYQNQGSIWYGKNWSDVAERYPDNTITYQDNDGSMNTIKLQLAPVNKDPNAVPKTTTNGTIRTYDYLYSDAWYRQQNGAYARLKTITIGYSLPKTMLSKLSIEKARVYFSGNDLFEITRTKDGWDPEARAEDPFGGTSGSNAYPFMRSYSLGIDLTF